MRLSNYKIPIERRCDNATYSGTYWREFNHNEFTLYYNDTPILKTYKSYKRQEKGTGMMKQIYSDTYISVLDMDSNKICDRKIKIIFAHNKPEDELPQLNDIVLAKIREFKINKIV